MNQVARLQAVFCGVLVLFVCAGGALAQPLIDREAYGAQGRLTASQSQSISRYLEYYGDRLVLVDEPATVSLARKKLIEPLQQARATPAFRDGYSALLVGVLERGSDALKHSESLVRQNAMVVVGYTAGGYGVDAAIDGLDDASWPVRYWAAKSLVALSGSSGADAGLDEVRQREVLRSVTAALIEEQMTDVRGQLYTVLNVLSVSEARDVLIEALDRRTAYYHQSGIGSGARAEFVAFRGLHSQMIQAQVASPQANLPRVKRYVTVAGKYVSLIRSEVAGGIDDEASTASVYDLLERCERAMNWGLEKYDEAKWTGRSGPKLLESLRAGQDAQFELNVYDWVGGSTSDGLLTREAIGIAREDLDLGSSD